MAYRSLGRAGGTTPTTVPPGERRRLGARGATVMDNALLIGLSRQVTLGRELEVVANNLANINTTGYKADSTIFEQFLMPEASAGQFPPGSRQPAFVRDRTTWHDFGSGPIQRTGGPLDVAIDGDAFLVVQTAAGQRYTRNGALQISATGALVTHAGDPVLGVGGPIQFQNTDHDISIGEDGTITVREGASATSDSVRGQLQLAQFADNGALRKEGSNLFSAPVGVASQSASPNVRVVQGSIEQSNVSAVSEMARMVEITRSYEQIAGLLQQQNSQRTTALDKLAAVPA
jgi:flagellar basal-body rod protein FlgF/flagellar basal-body rod protein FlgG